MGIARYRQPLPGKLLDTNDLAKLGASLKCLEGDRPLRVPRVQRLALIDAKTGSKYALLG